MTDFLAFNANTPGGQWAYVTVSWALLTATYAGYLAFLNRKLRKLQKEVSSSTGN
jgi:hypothetical protein